MKLNAEVREAGLQRGDDQHAHEGREHRAPPAHETRAANDGRGPSFEGPNVPDNAYPDGTDAEYQSAVFNIYTNQLRTSVTWPTLGNHDTDQGTSFVDTYPYFGIFTLPTAGQAGGMNSGTEYYYSFDLGMVHFICLDSMEATRATNSAMFIWLTNDLANVTADWTIAFWHHPPYTKGSHNSDTETELIQMRQVFLPVLEAAGVDLVLSGHSHCYERSYLLDKHYGLSAGMNATNKLDAGNGQEGGTGAYKKPEGGLISHQGTVYIVAGSSGQATGGAPFEIRRSAACFSSRQSASSLSGKDCGVIPHGTSTPR